MRQVIQPTDYPVNATVQIPGSKSITNRALLLAALAFGESQVNNLLLSDDTECMLNALTALSINFELDKKNMQCRIQGCGGVFPTTYAEIFCNEAGTVARFLLAVCASIPGKYYFDAAQRLRERPLQELIALLAEQGALFSKTKMPLLVTGVGLQGGDIYVKGDETSQFLSAMLMASPFAKSNTHIKTDKVVSAPYVNMTCSMMKRFGVDVSDVGTDFYIPHNQHYQGCDYDVEPDLSTASYFFAVAALTKGQVNVPFLNKSTTLQGDVKFLDVLQLMGCDVSNTEAGLTVQGPSRLRGVELNMSQFSDTFMTLAAIAPFADSPTTIRGIGHTRLQESDRICAMRDNLNTLGVKTESGSNWLTIFPGSPIGATVDSHGDHRIAMASALIGLRVPGVIIENAECVSKTCPNYFMMLRRLYNTA